jgi:hypothetical protein
MLTAPARVGAQPDGLPFDDSAPPEDGGGLQARAAAEAATVYTGPPPESPPPDNAFPISGLLRNSCSDSFGDPRSGGRTHMGVDCFASIGTPLVAVESGWIRYATEQSSPYNCSDGTGDGSGNRVSLRGRSGYVYYYGHLDTILVNTDQPVERGQVIGTVGRTGNAACSTSHLHIEVKCGDDGAPFDPYPVMATWGRIRPAPEWSSTARLGIGASFSGPRREDVFSLSCGQIMQQRTWRAESAFTPFWSSVEGVAISDADAASPGAGWEPQLVVLGSDGAVWHLLSNGGSWAGTSLGGGCTSAPSMAIADANYLDVACIGSDSAVWMRSWARSIGWVGWGRIGGIATSAPDLASPGPGYVGQVFVRGGDSAVWHLYWTGTTWAAESLGGVCSSGPSAAFSGPTRLDVFCRGGDMAVWHRWWDASVGWSGWESLGGIVISDPEAVSPGPGQTGQVFARGLDRQIYQWYWSGRAWVLQNWGLT